MQFGIATSKSKNFDINETRSCQRVLNFTYMSFFSKLMIALVAIICLQITYIQAQKKSAAVAKPNVLVFSKTKGYRHNSIPEGIEAFQRLGIENDFNVTATEDSSMFVADTLQRYAAVVFLNTTGNVLNTE